jgi:heme exporter protein D
MENSTHWLDRPGLPRALWIAFAAILVVLVVAGVFVVHEHGGVMGSFGFYAWFGFAIGGVSIAASKIWKVAFKRKDTYYD